MTKREILPRLLLIMLLGLLVRIGVAMSSPAISRDTCRFVWYAQQLQHSPVTALADHDQHPLYPALIAAAHSVTGPFFTADPVLGWQLAAQIVAMMAGVMVAPIVFGLARTLYDDRIAILAALFAVLLPEAVQFSTDGLSDLPHAALYLSSLLCGIAALRGGRGWLWVGCGALGGLAFLTRPEGMEPVIAIVLLVLLARSRFDWKRRLIRATIVVAAAVIVSAPYMLATGELVQKKSIFRLMDIENDDESARQSLPAEDESAPNLAAVHTPKVIRAGGVILWHWVRASRVVYLLLAIAAWIGTGRPRADGIARRGVSLTWLLHFAILVLLVVRFDYWQALSKRHVLLLVLLVLPASAAGAQRIIDHFSIRSGAPRSERRVTGMLILAIVGATGYWMVRPINAETEYLVRAGRWVRDWRRDQPGSVPPGKSLLTAEPRIPFYAGMPMQNWPHRDGNIEDLIDHIRFFDPGLVAIDEYRVQRADPQFLRKLETRLVRTGILELLHEEVPTNRKKPTRLWIYRVVRPPESGV